MAKVEITLPTVQYGNVKLTCKPEELDGLLKSADTLGVAAAMYLNIFTQGFQLGAKMDVSVNVKAPLPSGVEEAAKLLDEGLGGVTEVSEVGSVIEETVAKAAEIEAKAPWDKPAAEVKKPWETEVTGPVVLDATW